ncbi:MAG: polysaccharide deacetylase family protein [Chitinophagaceae bacterium]|nr:polysaccharide deacetylase family protein [Chitinophagaceae bacterium]
MVFTGDEFADGGFYIANVLKQANVNASFFLTGNFYRNEAFKNIIRTLRSGGHYLGPHSDRHLLYCSWENRDSLLVTREEFTTDLENNYRAMAAYGITRDESSFFIPPYEWYNDSIAAWCEQMNVQLLNFTPGTISHADYTTPDMKNYRSAERIWESVTRFEQSSPSGMNGFILLLHIGTDRARTDKMYYRLPELIDYFKRKNYQLVKIDELLGTN